MSKLRARHRFLKPLVLSALLVLCVAGTPASSQSSYTLAAHADGLAAGLILPGGALDDRLVDFGSPRAQVLLDSLGSSDAFAAMAHPGSFAESLLNVGSGLAGVSPPDSPLWARATHPAKPEHESVHGPQRAHARTAADQAAAGLTVDGGEQGPRVAVRAAALRKQDGTLNVTAASSVTALVIGPLTVFGAESEASLTRGTDGAEKAGTRFEVALLDIDGQRFGVRDESLVFAGTDVPLPETHPVRDALAEHGLVVRVLPSERAQGRATSAGLSIEAEAPLSLTDAGVTRVSVTVGRSGVTLSGAATPSAAAEPAPPAYSDPGPVSAGGGFTPSPPGATALFTPSGPLTALPGGALDAAVIPAAVSDVVSTAVAAQPWTTTWYSALILAAAVGLVFTRGMSKYGVRIWTL